MDLNVGDFDEFFRAVNGGRRAFSWQTRLLEEHVASPSGWPDHIVAPTGAGKSSVIDVHVFAVALMESGSGVRVPRRLSMVVDRRVIVDSHFERARHINHLLRTAFEQRRDDICDRVARALLEHKAKLWAERESSDPRRELLDRSEPVVVALLRGGVPPMDDWRDDPTACMVICATPDMWGSRLLMRGYGTRDLARPREAGLLAYDSVVVVDEAHLARQLVETAGRIAALEAGAEPPPESASGDVLGYARPLRVVSATATPENTSVGRSVGVGDLDMQDRPGADEPLRGRMLKPKPVRLVPLAGWSDPASRKGSTTALADVAEELRERYGPTVACVTNTVRAALDLADELKRRKRIVEVLVGRMRPHDVQALRARHPGLLTVDRDPDVDFVVATQTIEVGIDADFSAMVTELASGSAIAQRAGRVNRMATAESTEIVVAVPAGAPPIGKDALPYRATDLSASWEWLLRRQADPSGVAPWAVRADRPPDEELRRTLLQRLEVWDALYLARTSDDLFSEPDLALWLSDDLDLDRDISVIVRQGLPSDSGEAIGLLRATKPREREIYRVPIAMADRILKQQGRDARPSFLFRDDQPPVQHLAGMRLRPGDLIVLAAAVRRFRSQVMDDEGDDIVPDVLEEAIAGPTDVSPWRPSREPFLLRILAGAPLDSEQGLCARLLEDLGPLCTSDDPDRATRGAIAGILKAYASPSSAASDRLTRAADLLTGRRKDADISVGRSSDQRLAWVVIQETRGCRNDEDLRQVWAPPTGEGEDIALDRHQADVAERAAALAQHLGLDEAIIATLREAGALHDEGKRDARFQGMLRGGVVGPSGTAEGSLALAKSSRRGPAAARAAWLRSGLPARWRHEQLSAAVAWSGSSQADLADRELVVRLVGTTHGYGRSGFPHVDPAIVGADAIDQYAAIEHLFEEGTWDALIERTHARWGLWGCAFLESILRAADCQVSGAGR